MADDDVRCVARYESTLFHFDKVQLLNGLDVTTEKATLKIYAGRLIILMVDKTGHV